VCEEGTEGLQTRDHDGQIGEGATDGALPSDRLYTPLFFRVFAAATVFMSAVSLQFHFGQYIGYLGYGVDTLGWLLSLATVGTLMIRLQLGRWIDRFGYRPTWVGGALVVATATALMQLSTSLWVLGALRLLTVMATAAVMTTVAVFAARVAPPQRRAESIGSIGLAGFTGMILGASLGDVVFSGPSDSIIPYRVFFTGSAACALLSAVIILRLRLPAGGGVAIGAGSGEAGRPPSILRVLRAHWPGMILLVGVVFSMVFCLQMSFLERLAEQRGFRDIKVFFLCYGPTAMTLRIVFRRVPERIGRTRTLVAGLTLLSVGILLLVGADSQARLVLPGLLMGAGHCFVFPSMVDLAAERLPHEHRGIGTSVILGAGDLGMLIGFAVMGQLIDAFGFDKALVALAATIFAGTVIYALSRRKAVFGRRHATSGDPA
jgi:predicted MFS family arabinose efflux permease